MCRVLPGVLAGIGFPTWLTCRELRTSQRTRVVYDLLAEVLGAQLGCREGEEV